MSGGYAPETEDLGPCQETPPLSMQPTSPSGSSQSDSGSHLFTSERSADNGQSQVDKARAGAHRLTARGGFGPGVPDVNSRNRKEQGGASRTVGRQRSPSSPTLTGPGGEGGGEGGVQMDIIITNFHS